MRPIIPWSLFPSRLFSTRTPAFSDLSRIHFDNVAFPPAWNYRHTRIRRGRLHLGEQGGNSLHVHREDCSSQTAHSFPQETSLRVVVKQASLTRAAREPLSRFAVDRLRAEAGILQKIGDHPHVLRFLGLVQDAERGGAGHTTLSLVTQECARGTLADVFSEQKSFPWRGTFTSEDRAGRVLARLPWFVALRKVAAAMQHLHARGIVHRDLKPANVFLSDDVVGGDPDPGPDEDKPEDRSSVGRRTGHDSDKRTFCSFSDKRTTGIYPPCCVRVRENAPTKNRVCYSIPPGSVFVGLELDASNTARP